jgi:hypothetical protein
MNVVAAVVVAIALAFSGVHLCRHEEAPAAVGHVACHDMGAQVGGAQPEANGAMENCPFGAFCKTCPAGFAVLATDLAAASAGPVADHPPKPATALAGLARTPDPPPPRA